MGHEAALFHFQDQQALADWVETYLDDDVRDMLVLFDLTPALLYQGEDDGSLLERWIEHGNGVVWTGAEPFYEYLRPDGSTAKTGAGMWGASDILDVAVAKLCRGVGQQTPKPIAARELPSLKTALTFRALRLDLLGPEWKVARLYAHNGFDGADPVVLRNAVGGFYAQVLAATGRVDERQAVLEEFLRTWLPMAGGTLGR